NIAVPAHPPKRNKVDQKSLTIIQDCDEQSFQEQTYNL
ncbi:MAG: hypothetical protein ACJAXX_001176, partial [Roseivirga sp.]